MSEEDPSRVLHLRNVTSEVSQMDLQNAFSGFGKVENIVLLRDKNQALVQMDSVNSATSALNCHSAGYTEINGRRVYIKFSRHQELTGKASGAASSGTILLVSMSNPGYDIRSVIQITADLLYQVFAQYGAVQKIVVIQKQTGENRQQALIQYDTHETAETAKQYLQSQNVYVGTSVWFTLDIQYSNLDDLTIRTSSPTARIFNGAGASPPGAFAFPAMFQQPAPDLYHQQMQQQMIQQQIFQQQQLVQAPPPVPVQPQGFLAPFPQMGLGSSVYQFQTFGPPDPSHLT